MSDPIERQAAIDTVRSECRCGEQMDLIEELEALPSAQPYTEAELQKMQELEQAELQKAYECGRASAQPEIIRCKDCKWYGLPSHKITENCVRWGKGNSVLLLPTEPDDFCSYAERREDG